MTTQQNAAVSEEMSPHLRQRIAFIAALIVDPDNVNWPAISDTLDDLSKESQGAAFENSVELLREPILQKDARALGATIGSLLSAGEVRRKRTHRLQTVLAPKPDKLPH